MKEENSRNSDSSGEGLMLLYGMPDGCPGRFTSGGRWFSAKKKVPGRLTLSREYHNPGGSLPNPGFPGPG